MPRPLLLALAAALLLVSTGVQAGSNPCDDAMGGDSGSSLERIYTVRGGDSRPPSSVSWVHAYVQQALTNSRAINDIMSWPKGNKKTGCRLRGFTYDKLCVPKGGRKGAFRPKVYLNTSCGRMHVKLRIGTGGGGTIDVWGRSAS